MRKINQNKKNMNKNATIDKIIEEINILEEYLDRNNICYVEKYRDVYSIDLYYEDDSKLQELEDIYLYQYDISLCKERYDRECQPLYKTILYDYSSNSYDVEFNKISYIINSNKNIKDISFSSNGDIIYNNSSKGKNKNSYEISYNVNSNNIDINSNIDLNISDNIMIISRNDLKIMIDYSSYMKKIMYEISYSNMDIYLEIVLNEYNDIITKRIEIKNKDLNNKVLSTYNLDYNGDKLYNGTITYEDSLERRSIIDNKEVLGMIDDIINYLMSNNKDMCFNESELGKLIDILKDDTYKYIKSIRNDIILDNIIKRLDNVLSLLKMNIVMEKVKEKNIYTKRR